MGRLATKKLAFVVVVFEIIMVILYGTMVRFEDASVHDPDIGVQYRKGKEKDEMGITYTMFQDVHVMIFVGFGFLMTFLKKYSYGAVGFNMLISAIGIQWSMLIYGWLHMDAHDTDYEAVCKEIVHGPAPTAAPVEGLTTAAPAVPNPFIDTTKNPISLNIVSLLGADFAIAAVLISFGAVLGKVSPLQLTIMTIIELVIYNVNEWIGRSYLYAVDAGDSIFVHSFGAYFGLAVSRVLYREPMRTSVKEGATYTSNLFAMVGTLFLWMFWPSFNSGATQGHEQQRAVLNTYLALAACAGTAFAVSTFVNPNNKLNMIHIQNSTLAGGVAVGAMADMMIQPWGAMLIGMIAGIISVLGYEYLTLYAAQHYGCHDTCGVNNLHGMPAVLAGIGSAVVAALATEKKYGNSLYKVFPNMGPEPDLTLCGHLLDGTGDPYFGAGLTSHQQGGYQMAALVVTLLMAVVGGIITGFILKIPIWDNPSDDQLYDDEDFWKLTDLSKNVKDGRRLIGEGIKEP
jgi:ammonium transporter Rh